MFGRVLNEYSRGWTGLEAVSVKYTASSSVAKLGTAAEECMRSESTRGSSVSSRTDVPSVVALAYRVQFVPV